VIKYVLVSLLILITSSVTAQQDNRPAYQQFPTVPPFEIRLVPDSTLFTKHDLKKKKPVMIFLFSPDCDHCHRATAELIKNIGLFKKVQIVMVSSLDFKLDKEFYESFHLAELSMIKVGYDPGYFLGSFFKNTSYPAIYLYNKKGKFIKQYGAEPPFATIADELTK
jgi:cytochrome oxidase Cu insertion factor (SCO1/SenC/PrrC family)